MNCVFDFAIETGRKKEMVFSFSYRGYSFFGEYTSLSIFTRGERAEKKQSEKDINKWAEFFLITVMAYIFLSKYLWRQSIHAFRSACLKCSIKLTITDHKKPVK